MQGNRVTRRRAAHKVPFLHDLEIGIEITDHGLAAGLLRIKKIHGSQSTQIYVVLKMPKLWTTLT